MENKIVTDWTAVAPSAHGTLIGLKLILKGLEGHDYPVDVLKKVLDGYENRIAEYLAEKKD
ncbi:MAG: hypothetical protein ACKOXV_06580 [Bacteroidota bacterium]|jgi:hypothetical protein